MHPAEAHIPGQVEGLRKEYNTRSSGRFVAADNIDLQIPSGQMTALLGPSGSGRCLAGTF